MKRLMCHSGNGNLYFGYTLFIYVESMHMHYFLFFFFTMMIFANHVVKCTSLITFAARNL